MVTSPSLRVDNSIFFFFQAGDGIRALTVTGVQTCALPICRSCRWWSSCPSAWDCCLACAAGGNYSFTRASFLTRSEERRVGKELRARRWPTLVKNKEIRDYRSGTSVAVLRRYTFSLTCIAN